MEDNRTVYSESQKYLIMSKLTKMAYVDESRHSFLFDNKKEAEAFVQKTPGTYCDDKSKQKRKPVCSYCFASGAEMIVIVNGGKKEIMALKERHLDKHYYNGQLSANITRLVHTQDRKYLKDFAECKFIVPIRIVNNDSVSIAYATVTKDSAAHEDYLYLAFTDLYEYEKWMNKLPNQKNWRPLQIDAAGLKRIGKDHGIMFNIYGGRNIIKNKDLKTIKVKKNEDGYDDED